MSAPHDPADRRKPAPSPPADGPDEAGRLVQRANAEIARSGRLLTDARRLQGAAAELRAASAGARRTAGFVRHVTTDSAASA